MIRKEDADFLEKNVIEKKEDYFRIALSFCGNRDDSMDAVSEMILVAAEKIETLRDRDRFSSWSTQILINICRKYLRRQKRETYFESRENEDDDESEAGISDAGSLNEYSVDLRAALSSLRPIHREVIIFRELLGYTFKEIADALHIPVGTALSRYNTGIKRMRKILGGNYNEEA